MAQQFPEEITLRILFDFNSYDEFSSKNVVNLVRKSIGNGANRYTQPAKIARQVCKQWKALVDLRSSYPFRVTFAGITFEAPYSGNFTDQQSVAKYLESNRDSLAAFQSRLESCPHSMLQVTFSFIGNTDGAQGLMLPEFYDQIARIASFPSRLVGLEAQMEDYAPALIFLHHAGKLDSSCALTSLYFRYTGPNPSEIPENPTLRELATRSLFARIPSLRDLSIQAEFGWPLKKISPCNLTSLQIHGTTWDNLCNLLTHCCKTLQSLQLMRLRPALREGETIEAFRKRGWTKHEDREAMTGYVNQPKIVMGSLKSIDAQDSETGIQNIIVLLVSLDCPKLEAIQLNMSSALNYAWWASDSWHDACRLPSLQRLSFRGDQRGLISLLNVIALPTPTLSDLHLDYHGPNSPEIKLLLPKLKFRSLTTQSTTLALVTSLDLSGVESLTVEPIRHRQNITLDQRSDEIGPSYHLPLLHSLRLINADSVSIAESLASVRSTRGLKSLEVVPGFHSGLFPRTPEVTGLELASFISSKLSSRSDWLSSLQLFATTHLQLLDIARSLFPYFKSIETLVIKVSGSRSWELPSMAEILDIVASATLLENANTSPHAPDVVLLGLRSIVFECFECFESKVLDPIDSVLRLKDGLAELDALSTLAAKRLSMNAPLVDLTLRLYAGEAFSFQQSFFHESGVTLKVEVIDQPRPDGYPWREYGEWY